MDFVEGLKRIVNEDIQPRREARGVRDLLIQQFFPQVTAMENIAFAGSVEKLHIHRLLEQAHPGKYDELSAAIEVDMMVRRIRKREIERGQPLVIPFFRVAEPPGMRDIKISGTQFPPPDDHEYKGWKPL